MVILRVALYLSPYYIDNKSVQTYRGDIDHKHTNYLKTQQTTIQCSVQPVFMFSGDKHKVFSLIFIKIYCQKVDRVK